MVSMPRPRWPIRRRELRPAALRLRVAATLINTAAALGALALAIGAGVLAYRRFAKRRSEPDGPLHAISGDPSAEPVRAGRASDARGFTEALQRQPAKLAVQLLSLSLSAWRGEPRSLGFRLLGLRLVDTDGGEPARAQWLARAVARRLWRALGQRLLPGPGPRDPHVRERMRTETAAAHSAHAGDPDAFQQAMLRIHRENRIDWRPSCLALVARLTLIAAIDTPMPWSPLAQSPVDWLSRTVLVVDRRARPSARRHGRRSLMRG
jgi:hypothetical protein